MKKEDLEKENRELRKAVLKELQLIEEDVKNCRLAFTAGSS